MNLKVILPGGRVRCFRWTRGEGNPGVGWRVLVPSGGGGVTGIVIGAGGEEAEGEILEVPDPGPLILPHHLEVLGDLSRDYLLPAGVLLFKLLPSVFDWYEEEVVRLSSRRPAGLDRRSDEILRYVKSRGEVKLETLRKRFGPGPVALLIEKGFLIREKKWIKPDLEVRLYRLKVPLREALRAVKDPRKRELILRIGERGRISEEEARELGFSRRTLRSLERKGVLEELVEDRPERREGAVKVLRPASGKGEVLWGGLRGVLERLAGMCAGLEGSALILSTGREVLKEALPLLRGLLGDRLVEIHSEAGGRRIWEGWFSCLEGNKVVLGTFLSLLAPLPDLKLVAVLDESSPGVRLPGLGLDLRRAVSYLARRTGSSLVLTTPAPSLATYYLTVRGDLLLRREAVPTPEVRVLRRRSAEVITEEVAEEVDRSEEVLFLVRKEGYSYVYCPRCQAVVRCPECGTFLTLSLSRSMVYCTGCRRFSSREVLCPECEGNLQEMGFGVEKALEVVERTFGIRETFRFATYPPWGETYDTVVVLSADGILSLPTFRAEEEFFLYILRSYLCARRRLLIQTAVPDLEPLRCLAEGRPEDFYREELRRREREKLPPFYRLLLVRSRRDLGGYLRRTLSQEVRTIPRPEEGVYDHLVRFRDRSTLARAVQLKRRLGRDIIEVRVDPF
jgi:primosomal protein N' (replication factor Y)